MSVIVNEVSKKEVILEIKLFVNQCLYEKGYITEEMFRKAKEIILKH